MFLFRGGGKAARRRPVTLHSRYRTVEFSAGLIAVDQNFAWPRERIFSRPDGARA
jgi:hypothetical protein